MAELPEAHLSSRRLSFEYPRHSDAAETAAAMTPGIARWLATWPSPMTTQQALEKIKACGHDIARGKAVHFVLRSLDDRQLVGWTSAWREAAEDEWQLGFWIAETLQGEGRGFEAASTVLDHLIRIASPNAVGARVRPDNVRSIAILKKLGMEPVGETSQLTVHSCQEEPALVFRRRLQP